MTRTVGSVFMLAWYMAGLVMLWQHAHEVWAVFGVFVPPIPLVYAVVHMLSYFGV